MNNQLKIKDSAGTHFSRRLSRRILTQYFTMLGVFFGVLLVLFFGAKTILSQKTWYVTDPDYAMLKYISNHRFEVITSCLVFGIVAVFVPLWIKTLRYLDLMFDEVKAIYQEKELLVELPEELSEVEKQLNQTKLSIRLSEQEARNAEQRKNDLVVYLAHDLKTPLTSVIGYLTLLQDQPEIPEEQKQKYLGIALSKSERLEELINEFFEITRFNLTNLSLEVGTINLTRMLEQLVFEFEPMFAEKALRCQMQLPPDLMLRCDADKLQRAFDNLLRNAVSYSYEGSCIEMIGIPREDCLEICFRNHGVTIPKEKLERIFEQFYRLDSARASRNGGAGLGLAIAKQIVELHNGHITASSDAEIITFTITLPGLVGKM